MRIIGKAKSVKSGSLFLLVGAPYNIGGATSVTIDSLEVTLEDSLCHVTIKHGTTYSVDTTISTSDVTVVWDTVFSSSVGSMMLAGRAPQPRSPV